ncbi:SusC/RagA family TonB-linked outer membrane protein [Sphingobacterium sp. SGR-19]|uniref:SusC/RagA family TonB-linked outer membrane protein n=1 Tax=Sphingobacterium sp. SGR-19 TaxID=2710886 RepID=UPI0013EDBD98|nr:TonB-dependent receptor [Sphingobacterium sp. SGR-19]NGM66020.1 TonB-dependent receptor [Sphingobacterium sp. SGR-19]
MIKNRILVTLLGVLCSILAFAQQGAEVHGTVSNSEGPFQGVSVVVAGTDIATVTDEQGRYSIKVKPTDELVFTAIGYLAQRIRVAAQTTVDVSLVEEASALDEVVVVGYGEVRKKDLTGAVSTAKGADLAERKTTNLSSSLQGAIPGLMVRRSNNAPGSSAGSMHIRGVTTIGNSAPLVIIDGIPGDIDHVNPNDVESVSVLKDAASSAIYGSRAAAGVILITTKRGSRTNLNLTYSGEFGAEIPTLQPEMVGVTRYLEMSNELRYNDNQVGGFYQDYSADQVKNWINYNTTDPNNYPLTNWRGLILEDYAPRQTHTIGVSGGNDKVRSKATLAYDAVDGLYEKRFFRRVMLRVNNDFTINDMISATLDLNVRNARNHTPHYTPLSLLRQMPAIYAATWDDGRIAEGKSGGNPYGLLHLGGDRDSRSTQFRGRGVIDIKPFDGFKVSAIVSPYINYAKSKAFRKAASYTLATDPSAFGGWLEDNANPYSTTSLSEERNDDYNITSQLIANYMKSFDKHDLTAMVGYENYYQKWENLGASRDQYVLDQYPYLNVGPLDYRGNSGDAEAYAYNSYFGRLIYSYGDRYLLQVNARRDGSSRFHKDHRWGTFPSFSAGWVISEESFLKNANINWLSFLKLRGSWGALGNERIGSYYPYMSLLAFGNALFYENGATVANTTAAQRTLAVSDISWEKSQSTDIGLDAAFLDNRLTVTADYYWKQTQGMLLNIDIPASVGQGISEMNAGEMSTKGFDLELGWRDQKGDWSYGVTANLSDFLSKLDDMKDTRVISGNKLKEAGVYFNEWYGYKSDGLFLTEEEVANSPKLNNQIKVGDIKYLDISGPEGVPDGIISAEYDRVPLGNSLPRYQYGGRLHAGYKNFNLAMTFQGIGKQSVRLERQMVEPLRANFGNIPAIIDGNYWSPFNTTEENAAAAYPRLTRANVEANMAMSDYWLFNGRYFRLKNITLGYTVPKAVTERFKVHNLQVYASASDLFTWNRYPSGWDPEMGVSDYPITTTVLMGVSLDF